MFIEKGYKETTMLDIIREAGVSAGTFQNIFRTKDGVLTELVNVMFDNQFSTAESIVGGSSDPVLLYSVELAVQMTLAELNEKSQADICRSLYAAENKRIHMPKDIFRAL